MNKWDVLKRVQESGLVAVVRAESAQQAERIAEACALGGVAAIEVAYTTPGTTEVIHALSKRFSGGEIIIGAGTVLDPETAQIAILAGAQYIVCPSLNPDTIRLCNRYQIPTMPGAQTVREIVEAMEAGADLIKVFPGETLGPDFIKAVKAPLPHVPLMPTGGVSLENVGEWIKNGCVAVGVGGNLSGPAKYGDYNAVTKIAQQFIAKIQESRTR